MVKNINMLAIFIIFSFIGYIYAYPQQDCFDEFINKKLVVNNNGYGAVDGWQAKVNDLIGYGEEQNEGHLADYLSYYKNVQEIGPVTYCQSLNSKY